MRTYDYQSLCQRIDAMRTWQIIALTAVCAEKVLPIVRYLALPETAALANQCIELAWSAVTSERPKTKEGVVLMEALESVPELHCEYPDSLPFVVAESLSFSRFALGSLSCGLDIAKSDHVGFSLLVDIAVGFDLAMERLEPTKFLKGQMKIEEEASQLLLVELIGQHVEPSQVILDALKHETRRVAKRFETNLPAYCYHFVLGLIEADIIRAQASQQVGNKQSTA